MPAKRNLSISFHNFWPAFAPQTSYFVRALEERFSVTVEPLGKDVQFFSVFGRTFPEEVLKSNALKVWFTGEAQDPRDLIYDLYFNFSHNPLLGARSVRLPLWATYIHWWDHDTPLSPERLIAPRQFIARPKFCNFMFSNPVSLRNELFARLHARQHVDSHGKVLNNVGARAPDKMKALADYRFTIAFENFQSKGYVTEKLLEPLAAGSIPIYWGADECRTDFNPEAFIDASQFESLDALVEHVLHVDKDMDQQRALCEAPLFVSGIPYEMTPSFFSDRIEEALDTPNLRGFGKESNVALAGRRHLRGRLRASLAKLKRAIRF